MRTYVMCVWIIGALLIGSTADASGVLLDVQGKVGVTLPGGGAAKAASGLDLPDGSVVALEQGAKASVLLESGAVDQLAAGGRYTVGSKAAGSKRTDLGSGIAMAMRELSASGEGPTVHGMVKEAAGPSRNLPDLAILGSGGFAARFPVGTTIRVDTTIVFRWSGQVAASVIVIDNAKQQHVAIKPLAVGKDEIALNTASLGIAKGQKYSWYLGENERRPLGKTARYAFDTLSAAEEASLKADLAKVQKLDMGSDGKALLTAQLYYQRQMYDDMARTIEPLWQREQNAFAKKLLFTGYSRMGRAEEAKKYK